MHVLLQAQVDNVQAAGLSESVVHTLTRVRTRCTVACVGSRQKNSVKIFELDFDFVFAALASNLLQHSLSQSLSLSKSLSPQPLSVSLSLSLSKSLLIKVALSHF